MQTCHLSIEVWLLLSTIFTFFNEVSTSIRIGKHDGGEKNSHLSDTGNPHTQVGISLQI